MAASPPASPPTSPGPSLEAADELLLLSPAAHPELVRDDVAGVDPALRAGPAQRVRRRPGMATVPQSLWGVPLPAAPGQH
jgi:hypothetical protein